MDEERKITLLRCAGATFLQLAAFLVCFYHFLPYTERNRYQDRHPEWILVFMGINLAAGLFLTLGMRSSRYKVCHSLLAAAFLGQLALIAVDTSIDPTTHNLLPFEFVFLAIFVSPAYLGAFVSRLVWSPVPPAIPKG
jgi:FtsH-binding integral membrane protein